jgi:hypothetical protein
MITVREDAGRGKGVAGGNIPVLEQVGRHKLRLRATERLTSDHDLVCVYMIFVNDEQHEVSASVNARGMSCFKMSRSAASVALPNAGFDRSAPSNANTVRPRLSVNASAKNHSQRPYHDRGNAVRARNDLME